MNAEQSGSTLVNTGPRSLGRFEVGPLAFGCWRFTSDDLGESTAVVEAALDAGMNLVDTADVYGLDWGGTGFGRNEEILGQVLAASPGLRDRMVLATKGGIRPPTPYNSGRQYLISACDDSLRRLGVERIDLYQIHRPDFYTHPEEVAATLTELRAAGKIDEVGVSNFTPWQTDALRAHLDFGLVSDQPEFSLVELGPLRNGVFDRCMQHRSVPLVWSPLGGGRLASGTGISDELAQTMDALAKREGVSMATVAVAFVLAHPARPVALIGSQSPDRLKSLAAEVAINLDRDDIYRLIQAAEGVPLP